MVVVEIKGFRYGLPNFKEIGEVKLFPNPVTKKLFITSSGSNLIRYRIYTVEGRLLIDEGLKDVRNKENNDAISINLSQLKPGFHMLKLTLQNGEVITKHIIKQ